jgi:3-deoxy-D-manno-octulosonic-acid transferase
MKRTTPGKLFYPFYDALWSAAIPFLKRNSRIADGFGERTLASGPLPPSRIWIQSASAGEAYLTREILTTLDTQEPLAVHVTANTRQGIDILAETAETFRSTHPQLTLTVSFLPFDKPGLVEKAVQCIRPDLMVLVELELWPGLLRSLKRQGTRILVLNGRLTERSLKRYLLWPSFWTHLAPDRICAISDEDARRFEILFPGTPVRVVPNIKFDRLPDDSSQPSDQTPNPLSTLTGGPGPVIVLGSVREEEETLVANIIIRLRRNLPEAMVFLFPRHMHRLDEWKKRLTAMNEAWALRSSDSSPDSRVILWDRFGELALAYRLADAVFVGGSLAPLGGQNFLEALVAGVVPVIGPHWENFRWVGDGIIAQGLLDVGSTWEDVAEKLTRHATIESDRLSIRQRTLDYIERSRGGTRISCQEIGILLAEPKGKKNP